MNVTLIYIYINVYQFSCCAANGCRQLPWRHCSRFTMTRRPLQPPMWLVVERRRRVVRGRRFEIAVFQKSSLHSQNFEC